MTLTRDFDKRVVVSFGRFRFDRFCRLLLRDDEPVRLGSRAMEILVALVEAEGQIVSKHDLMTRVWPGMVVHDANLSMQIASLRRALDEGHDGGRYLINVPGQGYRFVTHIEVKPAIISPFRSRESDLSLDVQAARTSLVGRERDLNFLRAQLSCTRLLSIVGPGGVGKTSAALALASMVGSDYEGRTWFIDLSVFADESQLLDGILAMFGL